MTSILVVVCIAVACFASSNADTITVTGKMTCKGRPYQLTDILVNGFKKGSAGVRTANPKFRTNLWQTVRSIMGSRTTLLDFRDKNKALEINEIVTVEILDSARNGIFLSGHDDGVIFYESELNTNAAPVLKLLNDCSTRKACWMRDLPTSSINAKTPFDLGTIELSKLPANFRVVSCWENK